MHPDDQQNGYYVHGYPCRSACWEIIRNVDLNLFDDQLSNGGLIQQRNVAQIPYYSDQGCLVEIRQRSLTLAAYRYYQLVQDQTKNKGGLADTPPTALLGNVHNTANRTEEDRSQHQRLGRRLRRFVWEVTPVRPVSHSVGETKPCHQYECLHLSAFRDRQGG